MRILTAIVLISVGLLVLIWRFTYLNEDYKSSNPEMAVYGTSINGYEPN